jgi:hypothetical protein
MLGIFYMLKPKRYADPCISFGGNNDAGTRFLFRYSGWIRIKLRIALPFPLILVKLIEEID